MKHGFLAAGITVTTAILGGCGYHVQGKATVIPQNVHTIAIVSFQNNTPRYKLARLLAQDIGRELELRTHYVVVSDPAQADAVLKGTLMNFTSYGIASDPSGHATGAQAIAQMSFTITERATGKTLLTLTPKEFRERYEVSSDPQQYFDESGTAIERLSRDMARTAVSTILAVF